MDDNKILTLSNGERIPMNSTCKMVFEVENLNNASPATVSRCGIIYVSTIDLGWRPLIDTWCIDRQKERNTACPEEMTYVTDFTKKYVEAPNLFKLISLEYSFVLGTLPVINVTQMLNLLTALLQNHIDQQQAVDKALFEKYFVYSLAWAIGGMFETEDREKFHALLASKGAPLPQISASRVSVDKETIFDYKVDPESKGWVMWEAEPWVVPKRIAFSQLLIPTSDSTRAEYIIERISGLPAIRD